MLTKNHKMVFSPALLLLLISTLGLFYPIDAPAQAEQTKSGIALWTLNSGRGNVVTSITGQYKGVFFGTEQHEPVWKDNVLHFKGNGGYGGIRILDGGKLLHGPLFHIELDVKPSDEDQSCYILSCKAYSGKNGGFNLHYWGSQKKLSFNFSDGVDSFHYAAILPQKLSSLDWTNIKIVYNGAELSFIIKDQNVKSFACPGQVLSKSEIPLYIGSYAYDYSEKGENAFAGALRNVHFSIPAPAPDQPKFLNIASRGKPVLDGLLDDDVWKKSTFHNSFVYYIEGKVAEPQTSFAVCCDDENLYLAIKCPDEDAENIKATVTERDGSVSADDSIDIFIDPDLSGTHCFQFELSAGNVQNDAVLTCFGTRRREDFNMNWRSATRITAEGWYAEIAFPFKELLLTPQNTGNWYFNIGRACQTKDIDKYSTWGFLTEEQGPGRGFQDFRLFGVLHGLPEVELDESELKQIAKNRHKWELDSAPEASEIALIPIHNKIFVGNNMILPNSFILNAPGREIMKKETSYIIELPEGIEFIGIGGSEKNAQLNANPGHYDVQQTEKVVRDNEEYQRFVIKPVQIHHSRRSFGPLYLKSELPDNTAKSIYFGTVWSEGEQELSELTVVTKEYPTPGIPDNIIACYAWTTLFVEFTWPDFLETYGKLGFNVVPIMAGSYYSDQKIQDFANEASQKGFKKLFISSPFFFVNAHVEGNSTFEDGTPMQKIKDACPAYRGELYKKDIETIEQYAALIKPEYAQFDIEQYFHGAFRGRSGECARCSEYIRKSGLETDAAMTRLGTEIMSDIKQALTKAASEKSFPVPLNGNYHTEPGGFVYDGIFDFDQMLDKGAADMCHPVFYTSSFAKGMGRKLREMKRYYSCKVVPWLTMGYSPPPVEYPSEWVYDFVLEAYGSGIEGIYWYSPVMEAADFYYYAKAMESVNPVSQLLTEAEAVPDISCENANFGVSGLKNKNQYIILISSYEENQDSAVRLELPSYVKGRVWDLARANQVATVDGSGKLFLNFVPGVEGAHTALYFIGEEAPVFK